MKYLIIVGIVLIAFFGSIFIIATIRVLKQHRKQIEQVKMGEKVIAVLERNGKKEFIQ